MIHDGKKNLKYDVQYSVVVLNVCVFCKGNKKYSKHCISNYESDFHHRGL